VCGLAWGGGIPSSDCAILDKVDALHSGEVMRALNILPISVLLSAWSSLALAQAVAPPATAPTAPAAAYNWWWLLVIVVVVGGLIWWFLRNRATRL
jgi:hypothetical protein